MLGQILFLNNMEPTFGSFDAKLCKLPVVHFNNSNSTPGGFSGRFEFLRFLFPNQSIN